MHEELSIAATWCHDGAHVALARVIATVGSAPRPIGSALVVSDGGLFMGSVSGGCVEGAVIAAAEDVLATGVAQTLHFAGDADPLTEIALGCGGEVTIFVERIDCDGALSLLFAVLLAWLVAGDACTLVTECGASPAHWLYALDGELLSTDAAYEPGPAASTQRFGAPLHLVIVGADAVGQAVAQAAALLNWRVTVIDPRAAWLNPPRFPHATRDARWPDEALRSMTLDDRTAIVVLTHDPKFDEPALLVALLSGASYVGALGSRTANRERLARLQAVGLTENNLARLHAPIGLDLGGRTAPEIALSIVAEIIATRNGRDGGPLSAASGPIHTQSTANERIC